MSNNSQNIPVWQYISPEELEMLEEIKALKQEKNALILAHNYQIPAVQDAADYVGDSLGLARQAQNAKSDFVVFCGVYFMAETAKVLKPDAKVVIPDPGAGCSLVDTISAQDVRNWKEEHPEAITVGYVNTSADVKAELDYCCTSSNAVDVVNAIDADKEILFLPDMFLGAYVKKQTGRENLHIWAGECHVHAAIRPENINSAIAEHPGADLMVHPECGCSSNCMYLSAAGELDADLHVLSTSGMIGHAANSSKDTFLVATEVGILHQLEKRDPSKSFVPVSDAAVCEYMKMITTEKLLHSLREEVHEVDVPKDIRDRGRLAIERMVAIG